MVYFLYKQRPKPLELAVLIRLMDQRNYPMGRRRLAEEVDFLRSLRLVRVFESGAQEEADDVKQAKLIQRYADSDSDEDMGFALCVRITTAGINFSEGTGEYPGISRVE